MRREVLYTKEEIQAKVQELGRQITQDYKSKEILVISLLKGSFIFAADLIRNIDLDCQIEFMVTSSYQNDFQSSGVVDIVYDLSEPIEGRDVLIVDDIIDSGRTMKSVYEMLKKRNPNTLRTCTLLDKASRREVEFECDYVGFDIEDRFIVGYGLNYGKLYRNVDHIFEFIKE